MKYKIGDLVTRYSHGNDLVFSILSIKDNICYLKGINVRLIADANIDDLKVCDNPDKIENEDDFLDRIKPSFELERDDYFYVPGKILHIDSDEDYLNRCLSYYRDAHLEVVGINKSESDIVNDIRDLLEEYNPNIIVITGHDAYYKNHMYKNSTNFIEAVKEARKYEKDHEKLVIIAGACQSNYEELIKAGANFASSPKRINIHALDPAIIATSVSMSPSSIDIDLKKILSQTKYGSNGIGGIVTKGLMHVGYPR